MENQETEVNEPWMELHFSPKELVRSRLVLPSGVIEELGIKEREVRWQQGTIAVCILMVWTKLSEVLGEGALPILEGEKGTPARSLDNLLSKPGDWAAFMFGEGNGVPGIRDFIYRKRTVSRSNPISAVQWDEKVIPGSAIRIWQSGERLETAEGLKRLLRELLRSFNSRTVDREWERMFPEGGEEKVGEEKGVEDARFEGKAMKEGGAGTKLSMRTVLVVLVLVFVVGAGGFVLGRKERVEKASDTSTVESSQVVEGFINDLNAGYFEKAYGRLTESAQERIPEEGFEVAFGGQRYNFPRIAGNPYRNTNDDLIHEYRVTLYVETEVFRIPALEQIDRIPITEISEYADKLTVLSEQLEGAGIDRAFLNQLDKERLERVDASRYIQLICGLSNAEMGAIFRNKISATLDLTLFFEIIRTEDAGWKIQTVEDASERLVAF